MLDSGNASRYIQGIFHNGVAIRKNSSAKSMAFSTTGHITVQVISVSQQLKLSMGQISYQHYNFSNKVVSENLVEIVQIMGEI